MALLKKMFSGSAAPARCSYDADLVQQLKDDHEDLLHLYRRIDKAHQYRSFDICRAGLLQMRKRLTEHVVTENTRFYAWIKGDLASSYPGAVGLARAYQHEMHDLVRAMTGFLDTYCVDAQAVMRPQFGSELKAFGAALSQRISREEQSLFPLYLPLR